jgi:hypothetical protein
VSQILTATATINIPATASVGVKAWFRASVPSLIGLLSSRLTARSTATQDDLLSDTPGG